MRGDPNWSVQAPPPFWQRGPAEYPQYPAMVNNGVPPERASPAHSIAFSQQPAEVLPAYNIQDETPNLHTEQMGSVVQPPIVNTSAADGAYGTRMDRAPIIGHQANDGAQVRQYPG